VIGKVSPPIFTQRWRDYASIVVAVARADADRRPRSGSRVRLDPRRFRDWIGPWLLLHYLDPVQLEPSVVDFRAKRSRTSRPTTSIP
jgi:hypothetical protein